MTVQSRPKFLPAEVLEAGRRAEAEGRTGSATQFYRHVLAYYAGTPEAIEASDGLARLGPTGAARNEAVDEVPAEPIMLRPVMPPPSAERPAAPSQASAQPELPTRDNERPVPPPLPKSAIPAQPQVPQGDVKPPLPSADRELGQVEQAVAGLQLPIGIPAAPSPPAADRHAKLTPTLNSPSLVDSGLEAERDRRHHRQVELPPVTDDYRAGRALGRVITWVGVALAFLGAGLVPIAFITPAMLAANLRLASDLAAVQLSLGCTALGLVCLVLGQMIRAVLEQANAVRDLAALTRARSRQH